MTQPIVLASGNAGKLQEFKGLLADCDFRVSPQSEFDVPEAEETGLTFVENAILKARNACEHSGLPALADDSGLEVDALRGKPGIYSARFSQGWQNKDASDSHNNQYLLTQLKGTADDARTARYQCVLVFMRHAEDPTPVICQANWDGRILQAPVGDNGFGYDPLFFVEAYGCSAAQLEPALKNRISHRGKALAQLIGALKDKRLLHLD